MEYIKVKLLGILVVLTLISCSKEEEKKPNILWIVSEDNSPYLGCYGDSFANTPNIDDLAKSGFLYTHAYANAPVCAPARNTIITGVYANSNGHQHMRSKYNKSDNVKFFPNYLRQAGYYCTNNRKEDYNINVEQAMDIWDESSSNAHYKNRKEGQPFFAIFNIGTSHESSIHKTTPKNDLRHRPEDMVLPPYHPDTPEIRHDWAQFYDKIENMDTQLGELLEELKRSGEYENTIIFYYSDHGGILARSKRFVYETGTRVPMIVHIPEKFEHLNPKTTGDNKVSRLVSFVDLAPTILSLCKLPIPEFMQGEAFLGEAKTDDPEYAFMFKDRMDERYDMSRSTRDKKFRYIRNYMPYRVYGQHLNYLWNAPSTRSWEKAYTNGLCNDTQSVFWNEKPVEELYDTENDPWEINNLAEDSTYLSVLERLRKANRDWMSNIKDVGFIPEEEYAEIQSNTPLYDVMRNSQKEVDVDSLITMADFAMHATKKDIPKLVSSLNSKNSAIRYWAATGFLILGDDAKGELDMLEKTISDSSETAFLVIAEALYRIAEPEKGKALLLTALKSDNISTRVRALNIIDCVDENGQEIQKETFVVYNKGKKNPKAFDIRMCTSLLKKWNHAP
ncbi:sulfatase [Flagellimonas pacifica]|uniref:Arylsulfatase A n=1 Tax=Flagellimonas pacifica TaxID=1247520 RepID=A0A285MSQ2_9FLAO|nr:sulfatase [Allomuricauda parva]SNY99577.1 Arylsulfatase A [Allomuricauda parva]